MALSFAHKAKKIKRTFAAYALRCSYACNFALDANNLRLIMQINPPSFIRWTPSLGDGYGDGDGLGNGWLLRRKERK